MTGDPSREGFARRWSRLKRQAPPAPVPENAGVPTDEPIELPPPADTIPLDEIAAWLRRRVPEGWREVALRRVWSADTAIRDFVGPADYAWDWNTAGGAPGWGPLRAADDMVRLLARAMGEDLPPPDPPPEPPPEPPLQPGSVTAEANQADPDPPTETPPATDPQPEAPIKTASRRGGRAAPV